MIKKLFLFLILIIAILLIIGLFNKTKEGEMDKNTNLEKYDTAIFAGGCFWCSEADFEKNKGVVEVISGYTGGEIANPTYEEVSSGNTEHREAVKVYYDSSTISYPQLLEIFWKHIDPLDDKGQFVDRGYQYTSAIYYNNEKEKKLAQKSKQEVEKLFDSSIVTEILPSQKFYRAEEYHQDFYKKNKIEYKFYRYKSGRDDFIDKNWKDVEILGDKESEDKGDNGSKEFRGVPISELNETQYYVTQNDGTEKPFDNEYWNNKKEGIYVDVISGVPLFSSKDKYESGTGWPSFVKPLSEDAVVEVTDKSFFTTRTEIRGKVSDAHLGHVFNDGPKPTGLRYCMNSAALKFIPKNKLKEKGYGKYLSEFN